MMFELTNATSRWEPYLSVLPPTLNTPHFWREEERENLLKGTSIADKIGIHLLVDNVCSLT